MTDILDYIRNLPPDPYHERHTALCVPALPKPGEQGPESAQPPDGDVPDGRPPGEGGEEAARGRAVYTEEQALVKAGELIVQGKRVGRV